MTAWQRLDGGVEPTAQEFACRLRGEFRQKRQVVAAIDHERLFRPALKLVEVHDRTNRQPDLAQLVLRQYALDSLAYVAGRLSRPSHVAERRRSVVKDIDADARVVGSRDKCVTGAQAGSHQAQSRVAPLLQPVEAATNVDDTLPRGVDGAPDVGGNRIVGARDSRRAADVVVWHAHAQR